MIAILDNNATDEQIERLTNWFEEQGMRCQLSRGEFQTILGIIGDTTKLDTELISSLDIVKSVTRITNPGKKENQKTRNKDGDFHRSGIKTVGIIGLGLIGGSFAKAYKENSNARVLGYNRSTATTHFAMMDGTLDGELILNEQDTVADTSGNRLSDCDLVIISLYNQAIIDCNRCRWIKKKNLQGMLPYSKGKWIHLCRRTSYGRQEILRIQIQYRQTL